MPKKHPCPHCGSDKFWLVRGGARKCAKCRRESVLAPAWPVRGFGLAAREWRRLISEFLRDGTGTALALEVRVSRRTAYRAIRAIQSAMCADLPGRLSGTVEADATYVGGEWSNKRVHIRRRGTKRGRGTSKQCVFGVIERGGAAVAWAPDWLGMTRSFPHAVHLATMPACSSLATNSLPH